MMSEDTINDETLQAACAGDFSRLRGVPKTDLHTHLVLSAPFETYRKLGSGAVKTAPQRFGHLSDFLTFVKEEYFPILTTLDNHLAIMNAAFEHMISEGIVYTETSIDLSMPLWVGSSWHELLPLLRSELARYEGRITICPELGLARDFPGDNWEELATEALDSGFFGSVDLYGAEELKPVDSFGRFFEIARAAGVKIKLHSGETGSPQRIWEELRTVNPDAIQHGVRAAEDPALLDELARRGIQVNVCPWSNYCLRVVEDYARHPIRKMFDHGVKVTINTDDLAVFGRSICEEYSELYRCGVFSAQELETIRINGLAAQNQEL